MLEWILGLVRSAGVAGVGLLMFLENVFPPIPSEVVMPLAGFMAATGAIGFWPAVIAGTIGSLAGAAGWYLLARKVGERRLRRWVDAHGRWLTVSCDDLDRAEAWFRRHQGAAVFLGRLVPGVRTFVSVPAGFAGMPAGRFLLWTVAGTAIWTAALAFAGRLLGARYEQVERWIGPAGWIIGGAIVALYVWRVIRWKPSKDAGDCAAA